MFSSSACVFEELLKSFGGTKCSRTGSSCRRPKCFSMIGNLGKEKRELLETKIIKEAAYHRIEVLAGLFSRMTLLN